MPEMYDVKNIQEINKIMQENEWILIHNTDHEEHWVKGNKYGYIKKNGNKLVEYRYLTFVDLNGHIIVRSKVE